MIDLLLTTERREKAAEVQNLRREQMSHRLVKDPARIKYGWGVQRELTATNQLQALQSSGASDPEREQQFREQLAEGLAAQGKFAEAVPLSLNEDRRSEYQAKADALQQPGRRCACPETIQQRQPGNAKALATPTQNPAEVVWTGSQTLTFLLCSQCGVFSLHVPPRQEGEHDGR